MVHGLHHLLVRPWVSEGAGREGLCLHRGASRGGGEQGCASIDYNEGGDGVSLVGTLPARPSQYLPAGRFVCVHMC